MATLRNRLNIKVRMESERALYREIEMLFLSASLDELKDGLTIKIFSNIPNNMHYIVGSGVTGKKFNREYDVETFKNIIPDLKENGIQVEYFQKEYGIMEAILRYNPS